MTNIPQKIHPVRWTDDKRPAVIILDQTSIPSRETYLPCRDLPSIVHAIKTLQVRGAPLIGITTAYGMALEAFRHCRFRSEPFRRILFAASQRLLASRPTAVNLRWALRRMDDVIARYPGAHPHTLAGRLLAEAKRIHREDAAMCRAIGRHGTALLPRNPRILTICNTGALATGGIGTALAVAITAKYQGKRPEVFACETRPLLQGARLTIWELRQYAIPSTLICDGAAAATMATQSISCVIAGADRIAANGDTANKIGTLMLSQIASQRGIPFYIAAPTSTIDPETPNGDAIPIEQRQSSEVTAISGARPTAVFNPAFDVTPARLIDAIITDRGIIRPPFSKHIRDMMKPI